METISRQSTIESILSYAPKAAEVFESIGIDYCCGGRQTLEAACRTRGLDTDAVLLALTARGGESGSAPDVAEELSLAQLADRIVTTHHATLRKDLQRLDALTAKVAAVHGPNDARLGEIRREFTQLERELSEHMDKEEKVLFPMIVRMEAEAPGPFSHCESLANFVRKMATDHERAEFSLRKIRDLSDDFAVPDHACFSYRSMLTGFAEMENSFLGHMLEEHGKLFRRAIKLEEAKDGVAISKINLHAKPG